MTRNALPGFLIIGMLAQAWLAATCTPCRKAQDLTHINKLLASATCCCVPLAVRVCRYGGKLCGFSSPAALAAFVAGPKPILAAVRQAAHNAPLLFHMLGLGPGVAPGTPAAACGRPSSSAAHAAAASGPGFVASVTSSSSSGGSPVGASAARSGSVGGYRDSSAGPHGRSRSGSSSSSVRGTWRMPPLRGLLELFEAPLKVDAGTQTVTHVQERLIDVTYEWNDWALRRRVSDIDSS